MWCLLIVLLNVVPGIDRVTLVQSYLTQAECQSARDRVGYEMAAAYPNERDFVIVCQLRGGV